MEKDGYGKEYFQNKFLFQGEYLNGKSEWIWQ